MVVRINNREREGSMTKKLFLLTEISAVLCMSYFSVGVLKQGEWIRFIIEVFATIVFLLVSYLYQSKKKLYSIGYLFLFIICFINNNICPYYYTELQLEKERRKYVGVPGDYFYLYLLIYFLVMFSVLLYLLKIKPNKECDFRRLEIKTSGFEDKIVACTSLIISLPLSFAFGTLGVILFAPYLCYCFIRLFQRRFRLNIYFAILLFGNLVMIAKFYIYRYLVITLIFPLIVAFLIYQSIGKKRLKKQPVIFIAVLGIITILLYGVASEVLKLNFFIGKDIKLASVFQSLNQDGFFIYRQIYRLFGIWTRLGGNIIEHVQENGYFYGLTFIKALAPILGFEYISLPKISADYVQASYAQPGLLAEGYANFGIIGAVVNILIPFILGEFFLKLFLKYKNMFTLCLLVVPFTKVLLDGGSINSILFSCIGCFIAFSVYYCFHYERKKIICNYKNKAFMT